MLYDSKQYPDRISPSFKQAIDHGFDPIGDLIKTCQKIYSKANKKVNFHAWFPVFKDRKTANIQGVEARKPWFGIIDIFSPTMRSRIFAEPLNQQIVEYELSIIQEIVSKYPKIGINNPFFCS